MPSGGEEAWRARGLSDCSPTDGEHVGDLVAGGVDRRDEDREHRVDLGVVDRRVEGLLEVLGAGVGAEPAQRLAPRARPRPRRRRRCSASASELPTTATRLPRGSGWWATQLGDVEHLVEGVDLDHPGLPEHRVDGGLAGLAGPDRVAHRHALGGAAGLHRDHRLAPRDPAGDPAELARVADRLEVEQDHLGGVVLLPVLQQVVAGHVGAVAGRDERGEARGRAGRRSRGSRRRARRTGRRSRPGRAAASPGTSEALSARSLAVLMMPRAFGPISRSP